MIYTYLFTDKFFEDLRSNINSEQILHIIDFFKINFQAKENLHYCGTEDNLGNNFGVSGDNSEILNQFINSFHQTGALSNFLNKKDTADFIFCGNNEQIKKNGILTINCKKILNENESLKTQINNQTEDHWTNDDGKEDLSKKLKQLLKFSKSIVFIDRHVPACVADEVPQQLTQWRLSLEFFNSLISKHKINTFFINGINDRIFEKYRSKTIKLKPLDKANTIDKFKVLKKNKEDAKRNGLIFNDHLSLIECEKEILLKGKDVLKEDLKKFFLPLKEIKTYVMIKDGKAWRDMHDRYIFCFFENFNIEQQSLAESLRDKNLIIFDVTEGLNILDTKSKTTSNRIISRKNVKISTKITKNWDEKVNKFGFFYKFKAGEVKNAS